MPSRQQTRRLIKMIEDGEISNEAVVTMCLNAMSEDDVALMMDNHELTERFTNPDDDDDIDEDSEDETVTP